MNYHILIFEDDTKIASFRYESDRELCLATLEEAYPDAEFKRADD